MIWVYRPSPDAHVDLCDMSAVLVNCEFARKTKQFSFLNAYTATLMWDKQWKQLCIAYIFFIVVGFF